MSSDLAIGYDGKPRCAWAGADDTPAARYHDEVWGTRTYEDSALFEALTQGVFEAGLSWSIVFGKRDAFRKAFHGFDVALVAAMTKRDVDRLVLDASIIRNRAKIQATVDNARAMTSASPGLAALARSHETARKRAPRSLAELPTSTPDAEAFAAEIVRGWRGPNSVPASTSAAAPAKARIVVERVGRSHTSAVSDGGRPEIGTEVISGWLK